MTAVQCAWLVDSDWEAAYRSAAQAAEFAPEFAYVAGWTAMRTNRLEAALEHLARFDTEAPCWRNWEPYWEVLAQSLHILARHKEELEVARRARKRYPESLNIVALEVFALIGLGRVAEADSVLELAYSLPANAGAIGLVAINAARELEVHCLQDAEQRALNRLVRFLERPGGTASAVRSAQALFYAKQYDKAFKACERLVASNPNNATYLSFLGASALQIGRTDDAMQIDRRLEELRSPWSRGFLATVRGDAPAAVAFFNQAIKEGTSHVGMRDPWLHRLPDLLPLKSYSPFQRLAAPRR